MRRYGIIFKCCVLGAVLILFLSACSKKDTKQNTEIKDDDKTIMNSCAPTEALEELHSIDFSEEAMNSLKLLQDDMKQYPSAELAVAYLGELGESEAEDLSSWLQNSSPGMFAKVPFLREISEEYTFGNHDGELFCVVPRDDDSILNIYSISWHVTGNNSEPKKGELLYSSSKAEPVFVFVSYGELIDESDICITVSDGNTESFEWYPSFNYEEACIHIPVNENSEPLLFDFSRYGDVGMAEPVYEAGDYGALPPTTLGLANTSWIADSGWKLSLSYYESNATNSNGMVLYQKITEDGESFYSRYCHGFWWMEDDCLYLDIYDQRGNFIGGAFPVCVSQSGEELYIQQSRVDGAGLPFFEDGKSSMTLHLSTEE